jgi:two-component sensor histidine kinase
VAIEKRTSALRPAARERRLIEALTKAQLLAIGQAPPREIFEALLAEVLALTSSQFGFVGEVVLQDGAPARLMVHTFSNVTWTEAAETLYRRHSERGFFIETTDNLLGRAVGSGRTVIADGPACKRRRARLPAGHPPLRSFLGLPLVSGSRIIGLIGIANRRGGYTRRWVSFLSPFLLTAARVIESLQNERRRVEAENALRASLQEKEVLLKEIHHRVKNNLQVISSLISLQAQRVEDPAIQDMFLESQHRIRSMALIHDKLYRSPDLARIDFAGYIESLAAHLVHSLQVDPSRVRLVLDIKDVVLDIHSAIPLGLIINELISNALKHAFPWNREGTVRVFLRPAEASRYRLVVSDDGVGFPAGLDLRKAETLGLQIVTMLAEQLDGTVSVNREGGTAFTVEFGEIHYKPRM